MAGQVRIMSRSVIYKNKFRMGYMDLRRILRISCEVFWNIYLKSIRVVDSLGGSRGRYDGLGGAILLLWESSCPCSRPTCFPGNLC